MLLGGMAFNSADYELYRTNPESVKMAMDTLRTNKMRSGLTVLGIVIGVATVISISSVISGLNNRVSEWVSSLGSNVIWVFQIPVIGVRPTAELRRAKK